MGLPSSSMQRVRRQCTDPYHRYQGPHQTIPTPKMSIVISRLSRRRNDNIHPSTHVSKPSRPQQRQRNYGEQRATSVISITIGTFRVHSHLASSDRSMLRCWERYVIVGGVISQQEWSVLRRRARVLSSCGSHEIYRDRRATKMARLPPARLKA